VGARIYGEIKGVPTLSHLEDSRAFTESSLLMALVGVISEEYLERSGFRKDPEDIF
jgi:hypothetical protein